MTQSQTSRRATRCSPSSITECVAPGEEPVPPSWSKIWPSLAGMCRNITTLRGLEPEATPEEIEAAARQYVRKVGGVTSSSARTDEAFERAVDKVTRATAELLATLPARRQPPPTLPPLRRLAARAS